jgi:two-component system sensor kinase FixL
MSVSAESSPRSNEFKGIFAPLGYHPLLRSALALCIFEAVFYLSYRYGMSFSTLTSSPFWFPDSVLLCALLVVRPQWWWLILLATVPVCLLAAAGTPIWFELGTAAVDCAKAVLAAALLRRFVSDPVRFNQVRDFAVYCLFAALLVPAAGAFGGAALQHPLGHDYWASWEQWFLGDALANLIFTPIIFYWVLRPAHPRALTGGRWFEALLLVCGLLISVSLAFASASAGLGFADSRFYAPVPFLLWAAVRFGMFGASGAIAILTVFTVTAALTGYGPFAGRAPDALATALQHFLFLRAAPLYLLAVLVEHAQRVERSLRESEQRFRTMANTAPVLIWMSGTSGLCEFFNEGWLHFTGSTLEGQLGNGWATGVHPEDVQCCLTVYQTSFAARRPFEIDYRLRRYDGEYRWILDKGVPRYSPGGEFLGYIGSAIDVTDRRAQEAALRTSEDRYRAVVESQADLVCRFEPDLTLTFINEAYCRFTGRRREQLLGTPFLPMAGNNPRDLSGDCYSSEAALREPYTWECEIPRADGGARCQQWVSHGIFTADGALVEFQAIGHDITDRKHAEEANRKLAQTARLAALGELTAMIAHEINQPLCAILSNAEAAELLLQSEAPPLAEIRGILADICRDDLRADDAIRRVRALMQKREIRLQSVDLNETISDVLRLVTGDALRRRVQIKQHLAPALPRVCADRVYLEQVLLNLIVNGMDAMRDTRESARELIVQTKPNGADSVEVAVLDGGHGIPPEKMPHLFDSFFTTKLDGMGLGLSISRSIIQAHHGRIWAENGTNGGAELHFTVQTAPD